MKTAYKLINSEMRTHNGFQWELGKWYETTGKGDLCSFDWLYFYNDPLVGMFMNPAHANIENPRLFRAEVEGKFLDDNGLKCGYSRAKLVEELPLPQISSVQWIRFAILCAKEVYKGKKWNEWADNWLSGKNRTTMKAWIIKCTFCTIYAPDAACVATAAESAFYATRLAFSAAENTFYIAKSATSAAESVAIAVYTAEITAESKKIDLIGIARKAMEE